MSFSPCPFPYSWHVGATTCAHVSGFERERKKPAEGMVRRVPSSSTDFVPHSVSVRDFSSPMTSERVRAKHKHGRQRPARDLGSPDCAEPPTTSGTAKYPQHGADDDELLATPTYPLRHSCLLSFRGRVSLCFFKSPRKIFKRSC